MSKIIIVGAVAAVFICVVSARRVRLDGDWSEEKLATTMCVEERSRMTAGAFKDIVKQSSDYFVLEWIFYKERTLPNGDEEFLVKMSGLRREDDPTIKFLIVKLRKPKGKSVIVEKVQDDVALDTPLVDFRRSGKCAM